MHAVALLLRHATSSNRNIIAQADWCSVSEPMALMNLNELVVGLEPGVKLTSATGINDRGQIIANGSNDYAYLLNPGGQRPIPEPASLGLSAAVVAGFLLLRHRHGLPTRNRRPA
jgi:hypothetical protein